MDYERGRQTGDGVFSRFWGAVCADVAFVGATGRPYSGADLT